MRMRVAGMGLWLSAAAVLCGGCTTRMKAENMQKIPRARNVEPLAVACGEKLAGLVDHGECWGDKWVVPTGEYAASLFTGDPNCGWTIELVSSDLLMMVDWDGLGDAAAAVDYRIVTVVRNGTRSWPMSASGHGYSVVSGNRAIAQATCEALVDVRDRTETIMAGASQ
jgi:hypothetical protein